MTLLNNLLQPVLHDTPRSPDLLLKPRRGQQAGHSHTSITTLVLGNHSNLSFSIGFFKTYFLNKHDPYASMHRLQLGPGIPVIWDKGREADS